MTVETRTLSQRLLAACRDFLDSTTLHASGGDTDVFWQVLAATLQSDLGCTACAIWRYEPQPRTIELLGESRLQRLQLKEDDAAAEHCQKLLAEMSQQPRRSPVVTHSFQAAACPEVDGVLQIARPDAVDGTIILQCFGQRSNLDDGTGIDDTCRDALDQLLQSGPVPSSRTADRSQTDGAGQPPDASLETFAAFCVALHADLNPPRIARVLADDTTALTGVDRVSVLLPRRASWRMTSVTGNVPIHRRADQVVRLQQVVNLVVGSGQAFVYEGKFADMPQRWIKPIADYLDISGTRMLRIEPLWSQSDTSRRKTACGVLVFERFETAEATPELQQFAEPLVRQAGLAVANARTLQRIPFARTLSAAGRLIERWTARSLVVALLTLTLAAGLVAALAAIPMEHHVSADGILMPAVARQTFAPADAEIVEVLVTSGQQVVAGAPLLRLHSDQLDNQLKQTQLERLEHLQARDAVRAQLHELAAANNRNELLKLQARQQEIEIDLTDAEQRIRRIQYRQSKLLITAPIDGTVATYPLDQQLLGKPVREGEKLVEVMRESGTWQLQLDVPERRLQHVLDAHSPEDAGAVSFQLSRMPGEVYSARVTRVATRAVAHRRLGSTVRVEAELDAPQLVPLRIGSDVRAQLHCGSRSLLYLLFGDAWEFARQRLW